MRRLRGSFYGEGQPDSTIFRGRYDTWSEVHGALCAVTGLGATRCREWRWGVSQAPDLYHGVGADLSGSIPPRDCALTLLEDLRLLEEVRILPFRCAGLWSAGEIYVNLRRGADQVQQRQIKDRFGLVVTWPGTPFSIGETIASTVEGVRHTNHCAITRRSMLIWSRCRREAVRGSHWTARPDKCWM